MGSKLKPTNPLVTPLLTDLYQVTMAYAYWKSDRHEEHAVFDCFFRKNPFKGEFTIFAGLSEVLALLENFKFTDSDLEYVKSVLPDCEPEFIAWLGNATCKDVTVSGMREGSVCFPRIPLLRIEGPLAICQLLETTILNLTNYASLIATNAARMRLAAGADKTLLEFGLRRAQGPDGAVSASRYSYIGGFDGTSNMRAGKEFGITVKGTHAHAFVCSYFGPNQLKSRKLDDVDFWEIVMNYRRELGWTDTNEGELAAFVAYAQAFKKGFLALVDTYDTIKSGCRNFLCVALALHDLGHQAIGIRLDSGDLAYLSKEARKLFIEVGRKYNRPFEKLVIVASNDINENVLNSLNEQGHEINAFGIGTNLVTCQAQPALGMVFKLVEVNNKPAIKLSNDFIKTTIPTKKTAYRLIGSNGLAILDVMFGTRESIPEAGRRMMCRHAFIERKRAYVTPSKVVPLLQECWDGQKGGIVCELPSLDQIRDYAKSQLMMFREDYKRPLNPSPYKVSVSNDLYNYIHTLWMTNEPIVELC